MDSNASNSYWPLIRQVRHLQARLEAVSCGLVTAEMAALGGAQEIHRDLVERIDRIGTEIRHMGTHAQRGTHEP